MVVSYSSGGFGAQVLGGEQKRAFARERGQVLFYCISPSIRFAARLTVV
jgi:hypothetical protein